ncbi:hypothetical protein DH2020_035468 [Rehmannia glutinosa]|uniref:Symplekin C-terminal domain-containing protein n=1 Tax=Rehmannia glutinosa TaxID=99300 RepID=A0ABR0V9Z8_REHGL
MRTVIQAIDAFPTLVNFVMEILSKLVNRQLPSPQLESALNKYPSLRGPLTAFVNQSSVKASLPRSTLAVLGLASETDMQQRHVRHLYMSQIQLLQFMVQHLHDREQTKIGRPRKSEIFLIWNSYCTCGCSREHFYADFSAHPNIGSGDGANRQLVSSEVLNLSHLLDVNLNTDMHMDSLRLWRKLKNTWFEPWLTPFQWRSQKLRVGGPPRGGLRHLIF